MRVTTATHLKDCKVGGTRSAVSVVVAVALAAVGDEMLSTEVSTRLVRSVGGRISLERASARLWD